jgi:mRNA-degrading endonuclease RelE of RelBE toxin-antitoxin system
MFEVYLSREAEKIYLKANPKTTRLLHNCFRHLEESPLFGSNIKRLKGKLEGSLRYQIGGIRIIYSIDLESRKVFIETIGPRGDVYK